MKQITQDMIKVEKVINSCKTEEQLDVGANLIIAFSENIMTQRGAFLAQWI